jgi:hypothetical protein
MARRECTTDQLALLKRVGKPIGKNEETMRGASVIRLIPPSAVDNFGNRS